VCTSKEYPRECIAGRHTSVFRGRDEGEASVFSGAGPAGAGMESLVISSVYALQTEGLFFEPIG
jgi:hypothetical protein